jgi:hypothetical protein
LVLFGIILVLPVFGIDAGLEPPNYDINPYEYSINVYEGDSRVYVFQQIRVSSHDETSMITEVNEIEMELEFGGIAENKTINEGTKLKVEIVEINDFEIILSQVYYTLDGPVYYPDNFTVDRSNLVLRDDSGPRFIMTTNDSLINQVYDGISEWQKEIQPDRVHFSRSNWVNSIGYSEDYEYDGYNRFLSHMSIHNTNEDGYMDIELRSSFEMNPNDYTLGVATGDSQLYTFKKVKFYDWENSDYFKDFPITVKQGESRVQHFLKEGDQIYIEVTNTSGDYVKFKTKYYPKGEPEIQDDTVHIMDKTTGYFTLNKILHGPPILATINTSLIVQYAPFNLDITDDEMRYNSFWESTDNGFKQNESGSWDIATGWLNRYWREEIEQGILRHEFEIVAGNVSSEPAVGVKPGDSNTLQFTDILMRGEDNTTTEDFVITTRVDDSEQTLTMRVADIIDVIIDEVDGYNITMHMVFHSSVDGDITADSWTINIVNPNEGSSQGPMFVIPTDTDIIDDMFDGKAEVRYDGDEVIIDSHREDESKTYISQNVYDINTGWVIRMSQITKVDGVEVEKFSAESVGISNSPTNKTTVPSLTPVNLWPTLFFLIIAAPIYRRKR